MDVLGVRGLMQTSETGSKIFLSSELISKFTSSDLLPRSGSFPSWNLIRSIHTPHPSGVLRMSKRQSCLFVDSWNHHTDYPACNPIARRDNAACFPKMTSKWDCRSSTQSFAIGSSKFDFVKGFTLLEIMLVLLIVTIMSVMVVPRMFHNPLDQLHDESRRLKLALRLAIQESAMTGFPIRWVAYQKNYRFEQVNEKGKIWHVMKGEAFKNHHLPQGFWINDINIGGGLPSVTPEKKREEKPALGRLEIYPDGRLTMADISLATKGGKEVIHIRPGPDGISMEFVNAQE